jgi:uncharacterized membrane protein
MGKNRIEAFSDGVIAIIITIMVLELKVPLTAEISALIKLGPVFLCYVFSFIFIGIYWNNHHHMFQLATKINGRILWANQHLLFWLSLIPFVTSWMGQNNLMPIPVSIYGIVLFMSGFAYSILTSELLKIHDKDSPIQLALGHGKKGIISLSIYAIAIPISFYNPWAAFGMYILVALIWFVPDSRVEKIIKN